MNRYRYVAERIEDKNGKPLTVRITMKQSKPSWDNFRICNCKYGHYNCTCDGKGGKYETQ